MLAGYELGARVNMSELIQAQGRDSQAPMKTGDSLARTKIELPHVGSGTTECFLAKCFSR